MSKRKSIERTEAEQQEVDRKNALRRARRKANPESGKAAWKKEKEKDAQNLGRAAERRRRNLVYWHETAAQKKEYRQSYNAENSAMIVARVKEWRRKNPEAVARNYHNRRAREIFAGGKLSRGLRQRLLSMQRGKCACCGLPLGGNFHLDHIIPLSRGGLNIDSNIQLLRARCNTQKGAKDPIKFMQERGKLL